MKKVDFLKDVMHEIDALKKNATKKELARLDFDAFDFSTVRDCIYGQMTGNCASARAKRLMDKSCVRVMCLDDGVRELKERTFTEISDLINGSNEGQGWVDDGGHFSFSGSSRNFRHLSVLEAYIMLKGSKNKQIIQYLKGEIETLSL